MASSRMPARLHLPAARRAVVALGVVGALAVSATPAAAEPAPATSREAAGLIAARARDLEVLTEKFNEARERLKATERSAHRAADDLEAARAALARARDRVRVVARSAYTGNRLDPLQAMLTSNSPDDLLDRVGTLHAIAEHNDGVLGGAEDATHAADRAQAQAEEVAADAQRQVDRVAAQKKDLDAQIAVFKAAYDRLHAAEERASRAAAERRARDRAAAAERATAAARRAAPATAARPAHAAPHAAAAPAAPAPAAQAAPAPAAPPAVVAGGSAAAQTAVRTALAQVGDPYVWGAAGPNAFDCSGLMQYAYAAAGISLPHSSAMQSTMGVPVSRSELRPGDLIFFYSPVSHVGMYIGNGQMVHASTSGQPVKIAPVDYMPSYHSARRIAG
jgi:cell wall-associated NlpC family hydrolase